MELTISHTHEELIRKALTMYLWAMDLVSGNFTQTSYVLRKQVDGEDGVRNCCLGVFAETNKGEKEWKIDAKLINQDGEGGETVYVLNKDQHNLNIELCSLGTFGEFGCLEEHDYIGFNDEEEKDFAEISAIALHDLEGFCQHKLSQSYLDIISDKNNWIIYNG